MTTIKNLNLARKWFDEHPGESVMCTNNNKDLIVGSYQEAVKFFTGRGEVNALSNPEKWMEKIELLEREINRLEKVVNVTDAQLTAAGITRERFRASIILFEKESTNARREIESIIKEHPEVEPFYIMHRITK